jgi:DNA-binding NarL/FixJ family response regulator
MNTLRPLRIVVVDDHPMVREALIGLLQRHRGVTVCGEADSIETGIEAVRIHQPDLLLADLMLHGRDGLDLVRQLHQNAPAMNILVITMKEEQTFADKARDAGASGFIMKDRLTDDLHPAIEAIRAGGTWYPGHTTDGVL